MKRLRDDLTQAQSEAENLRTAASVNATLASAPQEDGSKSVVDQVAERVAALRVELEARHNERLQQNDEAFKIKGKNLAAQLSDKLRDGKAKIRQELTLEHEQVLQNLRTEHAQEIEKLQVRHQNEMDELRRLEEAKFVELKESSQQGTQPQTSSGGTADVKTEMQKPSSTWQPSEQEIRSLIQNNDYMKGILRNNLTKQISKSREELTKQLKEEHGKAIADIQSKNDAAKEHAVALAGKKSSLQLNMATNKARISDFKLGIVSKAAQETPQKPVQEVWTIAKDAKPPTTPAAAPAAASAGQSQQAAPKVSTPATGTFGRPTPVAQSVKVNSPQTQQGPSGSATTAEGPSTAATTSQNQPSSTPPQSSAPSSSQQPSQSQPTANAPPGPGQSASNHHTNAGTGPAALRSLSSGIPRGGSTRGNATTRGGTNQRGRGSSIARGAPQSIDTSRASQGAQQGRGSPSSALNAGAKQFVPGNKRPSEDPQGGDGKRVRGGGGGGQ